MRSKPKSQPQPFPAPRLKVAYEQPIGGGYFLQLVEYGSTGEFFQLEYQKPRMHLGCNKHQAWERFASYVQQVSESLSPLGLVRVFSCNE